MRCPCFGFIERGARVAEVHLLRQFDPSFISEFWLMRTSGGKKEANMKIHQVAVRLFAETMWDYIEVTVPVAKNAVPICKGMELVLWKPDPPAKAKAKAATAATKPAAAAAKTPTKRKHGQ